MANTCTVSLAVNINANAILVKPALQTLQNPTDIEQILQNVSLATGSGAGAVNQSYLARVAPAQNAATTLDLYNSALVNAMGDVIKLVNLKLLVIVNRSLTHSLILGGTNQVPILSGTTPALTIHCANTANNPSILVLLAPAAGWAVTDSTGDKITLTDGGEDASAGSFDILVVGTQTA